MNLSLRSRDKTQINRGLSLFRLLIVLLTFSSQHSIAQVVLVEATSLNEDKIEPSRSSTIITHKEIADQKDSTVADVLRKVPGLEIVRQGSVGQTTSVFIRGARSESTLVLIDGMEVNDAMSPSAGYDFSSLLTQNIERIEVYRGPQGVRFGAGALGGVINIITKEGAGQPSFHYLGEVGSYDTHRESLSGSGSRSNLKYSFGLDNFATTGFTAAAKKYGNTESDGVQVQSASGKVGWDLTRTAKIQTTLRFSNTKTEIDTFGGPGGDDPNNEAQTSQTITGINLTDRFLNDSLKSSFGFYYSLIKRESQNKPDMSDTTDSTDNFFSANRKIESVNTLTINETGTLQFLFQWRDESGFAKSSFNGTNSNVNRKYLSTLGESVTYLYESDSWFFDIGLRHDESSKIGSIFSHRASVGRISPSTQTKAYISYGTGYKLPSLYQLYSEYGDQNLKEENANSLELTVEKKWDDTALLTLTAFENHYENLIDYNTNTNKYFNMLEASSRGFESQLIWNYDSSKSLSASHTYLDAKDESTGLKLLRRPQNSWSISTNYKLNNFELFMNYKWKDQRDDVDPTNSERIINPAYEIVSLGASYQFQKKLIAHLRIENVFNEKYEEVAGYQTNERSIYAGLSGEF